MADADEGGSSHLNVVSGRQLRKVMGVPLVMMKLKMRPIGWSTGQGKARYSRRAVRMLRMRRKKVRMMMMRQVVMHLSLPSQDIPLVVHRQTTLEMG